MLFRSKAHEESKTKPGTRAAKAKREAGAATAAWAQLGVHCSSNERRADEASRDVEAWLKCYYMRDHLGQEYAGTITGVATFGLFVQLESLFVEGMIHISELGGDYFQYDESRQELRGERTGIRYRLTDRVHVQVSRVDLDARRIEFTLVKANQDRDFSAYGSPRPTDANRAPKKAASKKSRPEHKAPVKGASNVSRAAKKTTAVKAGKKTKKSNAKSKGHELVVRKGRR
mgnify:FL=1